MLVLTRKQYQSIRIDGGIVVTLLSEQPAKLGIEAPEHVNILRGELAMKSTFPATLDPGEHVAPAMRQSMRQCRVTIPSLRPIDGPPHVERLVADFRIGNIRCEFWKHGERCSMGPSSFELDASADFTTEADSKVALLRKLNDKVALFAAELQAAVAELDGEQP